MHRHCPGHLRDHLGRFDLVRRVRDPDVAVRDDRLVPPVGLGELSEILDDEVRLDAVARQVRERRLQEVEPPQRGELVQHQEEPWTGLAPYPAAARVEGLRKAASQLIEEQPQQRARPCDVRGRGREIETHGPVAPWEILEGEIACLGVLRHDRIPVEVQELHGGRDDARALVLGLVEKGACGTGDDGVGPRRLSRRRVGPAADAREVVDSGEHLAKGVLDGPVRVGQEG